MSAGMRDRRVLDGLRIERRANDKSGRARLRALIIAAISCSLAAAAIWYLFPSSAQKSIRTGTARVIDGGLGAGVLPLDATGFVTARRKATLSTKSTGRLAAIYVEEGQKVAQNEVIARIDDTNAQVALALARARYEAATSAFVDSRPIFERHRRLFSSGVISAQAFETARSTYNVTKTTVEVSRREFAVAQRDEDDTVVRAPFAGIVTEKSANEGEIVSPVSAGGGFTRTGICTIIDLDTLEVEVEVNENFIARIRANEPASIQLSAYPGSNIAGKVIAVVPTADRANGTVRVRVGFLSKDKRILPELSARVLFEPNVKPSRANGHLVVPTNAVIFEGKNAIVFSVYSGRLHRQTVRLGRRIGEDIEVLSGLSAGTEVALSDVEHLFDGEKVSTDDSGV